DRVRNRVVGIDPEDAVAGGLIHRRELIEASAPEFEVLDVHLDGLPSHSELAAAPRPGPVSLHRDPGYPVPLEDLADCRDRDIYLMEAVEVEADPDRPVLSLGPDAQDEGHDVRGRGEMGFARSGLEVFRPLKRMLAVPFEPGIELPARDPEESAGLTDIVGDLLVVLNPPQSGLRLSQLLLLGGCFSHERPPRSRIGRCAGERLIATRTLRSNGPCSRIGLNITAWSHPRGAHGPN